MQKQLGTYIDAEVYLNLKEECRLSGKTICYVVNAALKNYLNMTPKQPRPYFTTGKEINF